MGPSLAIPPPLLAVQTGYWLIYRFNPDKLERGENPFTMDSREPRRDIEEFLSTNNRWLQLKEVGARLSHLTSAPTYKSCLPTGNHTNRSENTEHPTQRWLRRAVRSTREVRSPKRK